MVECEVTHMDMSVVVIETNMVDNPKEWFMNIGATCHVCFEKNEFSTYAPTDGRKLYIGNQASSDGAGVRTIVLKLMSGK